MCVCVCVCGGGGGDITLNSRSYVATSPMAEVWPAVAVGLLSDGTFWGVADVVLVCLDVPS